MAGSKVNPKEANDAAYNPTVAAASNAEVSVPILPENGFVKRAGVGLSTFPILRIISEIKISEGTAPSNDTVLVEATILQSVIVTGLELMIMKAHVSEPVRVYY